MAAGYSARWGAERRAGGSGIALRLPAASSKTSRFRYRRSPADTIAIDELVVGATETLFLSGPSGCGKSTLLGCSPACSKPIGVRSGCSISIGGARLRDAATGGAPITSATSSSSSTCFPYLTAPDNGLLRRVSAAARNAGGRVSCADSARAEDLLARPAP